ncbi:MAG: tyrosine-type recombinase/integrase [Chloroflexi bacterium]|nr:tyrosine-type recombinase/integrase [Chloroflexota bacterium]
MNYSSTFEKHLADQGKSHLTIKGYLADIRRFSQWVGQSNSDLLLPQHITTNNLLKYRKYLLSVQTKASTINRWVAAIRKYLDWAISQGMIENNLARAIKIMQRPSQPVRWLNKKEQHALQQAIGKDLQLAKLRYPVRITTRQRDASIVILLLNTGLRVSELGALRLEDIDLAQHNGHLEIEGKGHKERVVPLNLKARKAMQNWLQVRPETAENDAVFIALEHSTNGSLCDRSIQRIVRRFGEQAGLPNLIPQVLRHTFAKNLVDAEISLEKVAALLGVGLTAVRHYAVVATKDLEAAVEKISSGGEHV